VAETRWLPDPTAEVFTHLAQCPEIARFVFVGGSALAWHLRHRLSEDLDFLLPAFALDRRAIARIVAHLGERFSVKRMPFDPGTIDRIANDGDDIDDLHQRYQVDGVKLEFFCGDDRRVIGSIKVEPKPPKAFGHIRVATLDTLFGLKALALASRWLTRDLFDIVVLCRLPGFGPLALWERLETLGQSPDAAALAVGTLRKRLDDPGLASLMDDPPEFELLRQQVTELFAEARREIAAR
jgi:hypothetical protein